MGRKGLEITDCPAHSCYDDFTFDKSDCMSGAADDFAYDHLGVFSWTTEFWDIIYAATGEHADTKVWYFGPTVSQELAVAKWADINAPGSYVHWYKFQHPQLGEVELGGPDYFRLKSNPPLHLLKSIVAPHAKFAVYQALLSPKLEILTASAEIVSPYFPTNDSSKLAQSVVNLTMNEPTINGDDGRSPRVRFSEAKVIPDRDDNLYIWKIKVGKNFLAVYILSVFLYSLSICTVYRLNCLIDQ